MIITQLDSAYAPWLDLFLESLSLTNPGLPAYVELVNFHPELARYFRSKYGLVDFVPIALDAPSRHAMAHRKPHAALAGWQRHPNQPAYIVCDVDLLFRRSLDTLLAGLRERDAGVVFRDGLWEGRYYDHLRVACGLVGFRDDRLIREWLRTLAAPSCLGYEPTSWFYDQITLLAATNELRLDYLHLDHQTFLNREFAPEACIWSAHMEPKELMFLRFGDELRRLRGC